MNWVWECLISIFSPRHFISHTSMPGIKTKCYLWFGSLLCSPVFGFPLRGHLGGTQGSFVACRGHVNTTRLLLRLTIRQKVSVSGWHHRFFCCVSHSHTFWASVYRARHGSPADWTVSGTVSARLIHQLQHIFHRHVSHILCGSISGEQQTERECFLC